MLCKHFYFLAVKYKSEIHTDPATVYLVKRRKVLFFDVLFVRVCSLRTSVDVNLNQSSAFWN